MYTYIKAVPTEPALFEKKAPRFFRAAASMVTPEGLVQLFYAFKGRGGKTGGSQQLGKRYT